jgi:nitrite reductase (NO-forming)
LERPAHRRPRRATVTGTTQPARQTLRSATGGKHRSSRRRARTATVLIALLAVCTVAAVLSARSRAEVRFPHTLVSVTRTHADARAALPPVPAGDVARFTVTAEDKTIEIAQGVRYRAWTFNGTVPGPVLHVRQGQTVEITFKNRGADPHSFDTHAARIPADVAFKDVPSGGSLTFRFVARDPGAFLYHCVTAPSVAHVANGLYGALIVDPERPLPAVDAAFVLVASEWYLNRAGDRRPAQMSFRKAFDARPDWVTFNGYANRYVDHPFQLEPGWLARFYVVNAGPNLTTPFHLIGGIFDRFYADGDVTHALTGVQTVDVPAGGGAIFDAHFDTPGAYGFVSHMFASADKGEIGEIGVGAAHGRLPHGLHTHPRHAIRP